jgi:MinD-like ATPase involved in chromosome partitioning or flagellar assembly
MNKRLEAKPLKVSPGTPMAICVWGTHGSPGRTTIAVNLACELVLGGSTVLLVDFDSHAPSVADFFGLVDEKPGVSAAFRLLGQGRLDVAQIERLSASYEVGSAKLSVLTGLRAASRWPELTREKIQQFIDFAKQHFDYVVIDVAAELESGVRQVGGVVDRNVATRSAVEYSDQTIAVFSADPVGVRRFIEAFHEFVALVTEPILLANRLSSSALGSSARQQVDDTIMQLCRREVSAYVPIDIESCDKAMLQAVPLAMMKRSSKARQAIAQFARLNFGQEATRITEHVAKLD